MPLCSHRETKRVCVQTNGLAVTTIMVIESFLHIKKGSGVVGCSNIICRVSEEYG